MKRITRIIPTLALTSPLAWAHEGHHEGNAFSSLAHLLSEPSHWGGLFLALGVISVAVAVYRNKKHSKQDRSSTPK